MYCVLMFNIHHLKRITMQVSRGQQLLPVFPKAAQEALAEQQK